MSSYKELLQQRENLERQIQEARQRENQEAVDKVRALVAEFELTADDIFGNPRRAGKSGKVSASAGQKVAPKYRNPATGDTWTGRGKPPKWIADQNREQYLIA
ncbi:H-NS family nucleoid-associated regulatory protein [Pseudorhodoferax sp. Leaf267]|uniref:H-NS histone family protein n=1 Tax=Pseudorhodoferax sp. Leaf267 TaxID=1736316 RepID=UPI0006FCBB09|nr:H-NS histone family protein [Pseudorhodoferax sp. Leaf267]KQP13728.1 histone [Pseudorhodoferax sp. Leaf267]